MGIHRIVRSAALGLLVLITGYWLLYGEIQNEAGILVKQGPGSGTADLGGPFELIDQHGQVRNSDEFRGKYKLIYFGYTYCPDICPLGLQNMTGALDILKRDRDQIVPIFITVDPERDTQEELQKYATHFHPNFVMLTGNRKAVDKAIKAYKVFAQRVEEEGASDYMLDHSTMVYLMGPDDKFITYFPHSASAEKMAQGVNQVLTEALEVSTKPQANSEQNKG